MKLLSTHVLTGPNTFHHKAVLKLTLDLENYRNISSDAVQGFTERLLELLPGLQTHHCSKGYEGGFVERLKTGTYFAHIIEHVILELTSLLGISVSYGKTVYGGSEGIYNIMVRFKSEITTIYLAERAIELVRACAQNIPFDLTPVITHAKSIAHQDQLGPSTQAIVDAATRRNIPCRRLDNNSLVQLGYGRKRKLIQATETETTSAVAVDIASDKNLTKELLRLINVPVPEGIVAHNMEELPALIQNLSRPFVVKPLDGNQGRGVSIMLCSDREVIDAARRAFEISNDIVIEEYFIGNDYRVLVVDGKLVAASERIPAHVRGTGMHTIQQLIEIENENPLRGSGHEKKLTKIHIDDALLSFLTKRNLSLESVPHKDEMVQLRETANLSTGGTARDVTDTVHPEVKIACERAARTIGLNICGIDLIHTDISEPFPGSGCGIIELNSAPGIRMHEFPIEGTPRRVSDAIIDSMFPALDDGRIPIFSITGTNGKTTVTRMLAHVLRCHMPNAQVGMTTTDGIFINELRVASGDTTGFRSARALLSDPTIDIAVLEIARGGLIKGGLAYDWSDVSVLTNIQPDHFGQDNIYDLNDLLKVKGLVAERVKEGGVLVLNADDKLLQGLSEQSAITRIARQIIYFSTINHNDFIKHHIQRGGRAYFVDSGWIIEANGSSIQKIMPTIEVPQSVKGRLHFQVANALAVCGAAGGYGIPAQTLREGIKNFTSINNPGRINWFRVKDAYVIVDYGHNVGAFNAMERFIETWPGQKLGVVGLPGDRTDELIAEAAISATRMFDRVIIREDVDKRGRHPYETASIIERVMLENFPEKPRETILDEYQAILRALEELRDGDLLVIFYEDRKAAESALIANGAVEAFEVDPSIGFVKEAHPSSVGAHA